MSNKKTSGGFSSLVASISIAISLVIGILVYLYIFGDSSNFVNVNNFVVKIKGYLEAKDIKSAIAECDRQRGSLANVVRAGLEKYEHVQNDPSMDKEQKLELLKKELEEATALELPMLSKNLVVLSTCASIATLIGLIGTVMGMIKSFAAMAGGTPDTAQLATGISEPLINTALGITGSTIAIIMFNLFSTKIDQMTYSMDEAAL